jgi:flagellar motility protein MotE (MotC chaperone)
MRILLGLFVILISVSNIYAEDDIAKILEKQQKEIANKEETIKKETVRLETLKREVEEDIAKYTSLLKEIDKSLKQAEEIGVKRLKHVAKAYESMPPESAASRLSGLDNDTAILILLKMNSKKAGLVIGNMESEKATVLTKQIAKLRK